MKRDVWLLFGGGGEVDGLGTMLAGGMDSFKVLGGRSGQQGRQVAGQARKTVDGTGSDGN